MNPLFNHAIEVIETIEQAGYQAYIVGGAVRDYLLKRSVNDIDLATSAKPAQIQALFESVIPVGIEHGTVLVRYKGYSFEVTTFRTESGYSDYRHPDHVAFVNRIEDDLARRDFTCNAIAMTKQLAIIDPYRGLDALAKGYLRAVGNPSERFIEDPLRMLRAFRFVSQLQFTIEPETKLAIHHNIKLIERVAIERITVELNKLFKGPNYQLAVQYSSQATLFNYLPIFKEDNSYTDLLVKLKSSLPKLIFVFVYLVDQMNREITLKQWAKAFHLTNKDVNEGETVLQAVLLYRKVKLSNWLVYQLPEKLDQVFCLLLLAIETIVVEVSELQLRRQLLPINNRSELSLNGSDLIKLYPDRSKGKWLSNYLAEIEYLVVEGTITNNYQEIKEWILTCHPPEKS